ncbi:MAG: aminopeptidase P family protein [Sediminibacterium sp.]|nr:aminopeptidase P family protein [Sediminibacterium sp.]
MKGFTIATTIFFLVFSAQAQVMSVKDQAVTINEVLTDRIDHLLPKLMDEAKIDCWLIISREYNEDPILKTFLPAEWLSARRTTMLVFYRDKKNESIHSYAIARYQVGKRIQAAWNPEKEPNQWKALSKLIDSLNPNQIALNTSKDYGHADGLHYTEFNELNNAMSPNLLKKIVSAEKLGVAWLETRTEKEMTFYPTLLAISHQIIKEGFSNKVIQPNKTTTNDLVWWFRQKVSDLGLSTWFHPSVEIQRRESNEKDAIIRRGDLLHVDFGISYLRLNSDVQEHAYVLLPNEKTAPAFKTGRTGNEILAASLNQAKAEGIQPSIYTHPIGFHGHAAGTTIGMWDMQQGVPGSGDYEMRPNTCYSIELNATHTIAGWNRPVRIALEQNGCYNGSSFDYLDGRQKTILLIQ